MIYLKRAAFTKHKGGSTTGLICSRASKTVFEEEFMILCPGQASRVVTKIIVLITGPAEKHTRVLIIDCGDHVSNRYVISIRGKKLEIRTEKSCLL